MDPSEYRATIGMHDFITSPDNNDLWMQMAEAQVCVDAREQNGCLEIVIPVGLSSKTRQLRAAVRIALEYRNRLRKIQGNPTPTLKDITLIELDMLFQDGLTYAQIAKRVNSDTARVLSEYCRFIDESPKPQQDDDQIIAWFSSKPMMDYLMSRMRLRDLGVSSANIDACFDDGQKRIRAGLPPFDAGYPVSRQTIINALGYWKKNRKAAIIKSILRKNAPTNEPPVS